MMLVRMLSLGKERFKIMHINYVLISILFTCIKKKINTLKRKEANNTFVFSETADTLCFMQITVIKLTDYSLIKFNKLLEILSISEK